MTISGTTGNDDLNGTTQADDFDFTLGGDDTAHGRKGNDVFRFGETLSILDRIGGGAGSDTVALQGDYSGGLTVTHDMLSSVEALEVHGGFDYVLDLTRLKMPAHQALLVDGSELGAGDTLNADGTGQKSGFGFAFLGGAGNDVLTGGAGNNFFRGGGGADRLTAGAGAETFDYVSASQSTGANFDTIVRFDSHFDIISPELTSGSGVHALDPAVKKGFLSLETFDHDLEQAVGAGELGAGDGVLFRARQGTLAHEWFAIVDGNGMAGYQAGADLVIHLENLLHLRDFVASNFSPPG